MLDIRKGFDYLESDKFKGVVLTALNSQYPNQALNLSNDEMITSKDIQFGRYSSEENSIPNRYVVWSWDSIDTSIPTASSMRGVRRKPSVIRSVQFAVGLYSYDDPNKPDISARRFTQDVFRLGEAIQSTGLFQVSYRPYGYVGDRNYHFTVLELELA